MNILILSAGTRNKIVRYFKNLNDVKVVAADMQVLAPAIYEADKFYTVPRIDDENYINIVLDICRKESIDTVISLIDPELSLLAENNGRLSAAGVTYIGSSYELCEMALDKMQMYRWLSSHNYKCAKSYDKKEDFYADLEKGEISFPVFVKPVKGSASISIFEAKNKETVDFLWSQCDGLMIQEYLHGQEIGADCYIDMISGETVSVFTKKKLRMRAGETDKSVSFKDPKLFELIEKFNSECGWRGQIDIDIFEVDGEYYISEVNPRFGGGYPHAYECGCNHMELIRNNIEGKINEKNIGNYDDGVYMFKYCECMVKKL